MKAFLRALILVPALVYAVESPPAPPAPAPAPAPVLAPVPVPAPERPYLGVFLEETGGFDAPTVLRVSRVTPGATFDRMGVKAGDRLSTLNGGAVSTMDQFRDAIANLKADDRLAVGVTRDDGPAQLTGTIVPLPRPRDVIVDADRLRADVADVRDAVARANTKMNLEQALRLLREIEAGLPQAAAEFKRLYPKGTFNVQMTIDIRSDPQSPQQTPLRPAQPAPAAPAGPADAKANDALPPTPAGPTNGH